MTTSPAGSEWTVLVAGEQTGGRVAVILTRAGRGVVCPRHIHSREDELLCVIAGRATVERDDERHDAPGGTCLFLPRGSAHGFRVSSDEARLMVVLAPAGLEHSLGDLNRLGAPGGGQSVEQLVTTAARYGVTISAADADV